MEKFNVDFSQQAKKVLMRHNLHNKIAVELKKRNLEFLEEHNCKVYYTYNLF